MITYDSILETRDSYLAASFSMSMIDRLGVMMLLWSMMLMVLLVEVGLNMRIFMSYRV